MYIHLIGINLQSMEMPYGQQLIIFQLQANYKSMSDLFLRLLYNEPVC